MKKVVILSICMTSILWMLTGCAIGDYMIYKEGNHVQSDNLKYWEYTKAEEKADDLNMEVDSYLAMEYYGLEYNQYQVISLIAKDKGFENYMNELLDDVNGDMSKLEENINSLLNDYYEQVSLDLAEDANEKDVQPSAWIGTWNGKMKITAIDMPEAYSDEEKSQILGTSYDIMFTIRIDDMGHYIIEMIDDNSDLREASVSINDKELIIYLKSKETDDGEVVYQGMSGKLSEDENSHKEHSKQA